MKMLNGASFREIRTWIHRNARPLELALWNGRYENGSRLEILKGLACYQNSDGGFGNGIEPDCWNVSSSPYATMKAIEILRKTQLLEEIGNGHPMVQGIFRYLESGEHSDEDGWFFCIPSNDSFARAPWWTFSEETNRIQSMGITAGLCAFILRYGADRPALYGRAKEYAGKILDKIADTGDFGEMGIGGIAILLGDIMECGLSPFFHCDGVMEKLLAAGNKSIERDPDKWQFYTPRPSAFIWSRQSPFYPGNEAIVERQLDYLINTRNPGGVWNINWSWFDLGAAYAKEFAISENWWMATVAMDNLEFLNAFGRLLKEGEEL